MNSVVLVAVCWLLWTGSATVGITSPIATPFPDDSLPYKYANFGEIPYGKSLNFDLVQLSDSLCDDLSHLEHLLRPSYILTKSDASSACSFTKRALNAQSIGAKGIIVASPVVEYSSDVVMANDGHGRKVHITCLFINEANYTSLVGLQDIEIMVYFPVVKTSPTSMAYYLSIVSRDNFVFLRQFHESYKLIANEVRFEPIYQTMACAWCSPANCIDKYCAFDFEKGQFDTGSNILLQQLLQYNVFRQKGVEMWFQYMDEFDRNCNDNWYNVDKCSKDVLSRLSISDVRVTPDMMDVMECWRVNQKLLGFEFAPEIAVNSLIYTGNLEPQDVLAMVCAGMAEPSSVCEGGESGTSTRQGRGYLALWISGTIIVVLSIGVLAYHKLFRRELTNDMSSKVNELVARYATKVSEQARKKKDKLHERMSEEL